MMHNRLIVALLCAGFLHGTVLAQDREHWVASWGTAQLHALETLPPWVQPPPADQLPPNPPPSPIPPVPMRLKNQTVRMVVRASIGGKYLRLQFSNARGTQPVHLGTVHVARHADGASIIAGSDRSVTFYGKPEITVQPGALVISDPVELSVDPLSDLAVSIYLPGDTDARTTHALGLNTTYIAAGDTVANPDLSGVASNRSYFWFAGLEVQAPGRDSTVIAFGDSITDGFATSANMHRDWPELLAARLQQNPATARLGAVNVGISGNRVLRDGAGASALSRFDRDVLARAGVSWMVLLEGINDITFTALPGIPASQQTNATELIEGLSQLIDRAHAHGIKVMGATLTPMGGLWLYNDTTEDIRQAVNAWIRTSGRFDAVVDFDAATRDPDMPSRLKPEFDSGDHIHPNDAGNAAMAAVIDTAMFLR